MKHSIDYTNDVNANLKAIEDVKSYLGSNLFKAFINAIKVTDSIKEVHIICAFIGVVGFPVNAIIEKYTNFN